MYFELALISVLIAGGYWGWYFVRHDATRLYGVLVIGAAGLSGLGLLGRKMGESSLGVPGAIGVGTGVCLLLLGPLARSAARRLAGAERFGAARRMLDVAEVLAPGSGVADEKALLAAMREIRDGNIERTVDALNAAKIGAAPDARLAIDERIAMLYLAAYRWDEAIVHAEEHLFGATPSLSIPTAGASPTPIAIRRALGLAPPVWVELLGAYGYKGDLDQAARMLAKLEEICAGRPDAGIWLHRGRLIFLALAGRVGAVRTLVEPSRSRHMKKGARAYWVAVAHERQGEKAAAESAYARARSKSRGRPRALIDQALARLPSATPIELGPVATEVAARVEAEPPPVVVERPQPRAPIATRVIVLSLLAVSAVVSIVLGPTSDIGVLVRDGALVRGFVHDGEWWRIVTSLFLHVGGLHLLFNALSLLMMGRLVEDLFGSWRTIAIYALAGIGGAVASFLAAPVGITAGASGAVFGIVGAVFVELTLHRKRHRAVWLRAVWGSLAVVTVGNLAAGFYYTGLDQWSHAGGLAAGSLAGLVFSPNLRWQRAAYHVARVVAVAFVALVITCAVLVARTPMAETLGRETQVRRAVSGATVVVPSSWGVDKADLVDPQLPLQLHLERGPLGPGPLDTKLDPDAEARHATDKLGMTEVRSAPDRVVPMPFGWESTELTAKVDDQLATQHFRIVLAVRRVDDVDVMTAVLYMPDTIAHAAPGFFTAMLASIEPAR